MLIESYALVAVFYLAFAVAAASGTADHPAALVFGSMVGGVEASLHTQSHMNRTHSVIFIVFNR
jgi:hypothetical protein